jgi:MFS family permease
MTLTRQFIEAPNGGWGWAVVFGSQLSNMFNLSVISIFGLMFGPHLSAMNESESRIALVMNLRSAFLNMTGLVTGPVMKTFSPRTVTVSGSLLISLGLMLSSFTTTLNQVIFTYSLLVGVGLGLIAPAIFMAVSSYFTTRKSRAIGLSMAGTCVGQMILPQIVGILLGEYGFNGTVLVMGSLALHGVLGATLFQPVKWHTKKREIEVEKLVEAVPLKIEVPSKASLLKETEIIQDTFWKKLSKTMDLSLLQDLRFMILNLGLACVYTVSTDFNLLLPFFLQVRF